LYVFCIRDAEEWLPSWGVLNADGFFLLLNLNVSAIFFLCWFGCWSLIWAVLCHLSWVCYFFFVLYKTGCVYCYNCWVVF